MKWEEGKGEEEEAKNGLLLDVSRSRNWRTRDKDDQVFFHTVPFTAVRKERPRASDAFFRRKDGTS